MAEADSGTLYESPVGHVNLGPTPRRPVMVVPLSFPVYPNKTLRLEGEASISQLSVTTEQVEGKGWLLPAPEPRSRYIEDIHTWYPQTRRPTVEDRAIRVTKLLGWNVVGPAFFTHTSLVLAEALSKTQPVPTSPRNTTPFTIACELTLFGIDRLGRERFEWFLWTPGFSRQASGGNCSPQ